MTDGNSCRVRVFGFFGNGRDAGSAHAWLRPSTHDVLMGRECPCLPRPCQQFEPLPHYPTLQPLAQNKVPVKNSDTSKGGGKVIVSGATPPRAREDPPAPPLAYVPVWLAAGATKQTAAGQTVHGQEVGRVLSSRLRVGRVVAPLGEAPGVPPRTATGPRLARTRRVTAPQAAARMRVVRPPSAGRARPAPAVVADRGGTSATARPRVASRPAPHEDALARGRGPLPPPLHIRRLPQGPLPPIVRMLPPLRQTA
ncbi:hypothetical protein FIBSPDRAFT_894091 [Athelia psychrophila]|uniref:Uncharacterized protein n=1 Tax=Athelia psychrophila TaxID=1759441 RepID=A0A166GC32_9AGAM|nr:hypothetical protein FIBSPDRAFT_894091 [Fibularhizoctonia sp. CBS 109695]